MRGGLLNNAMEASNDNNYDCMPLLQEEGVFLLVLVGVGMPGFLIVFISKFELCKCCTEGVSMNKLDLYKVKSRGVMPL